MDKYGVETEKTKTELEKKGAEGETCPKCGQKLSKDTNVPHCPNCGTKPFEKSDEG